MASKRLERFLFVAEDKMNQEWMKKLISGEEGDCPCCGRYAKVYTRRLHHSVARQLIIMLKMGGDKEWIHARSLILPGMSGAGDLGKARYWKLIDPKANDNDEQKSSGYWKLTDRGIRFINAQCKVHEWCIVFDDLVLERGGNYVSIYDCLGEKFSYKDLMAA